MLMCLEPDYLRTSYCVAALPRSIFTEPACLFFYGAYRQVHFRSNNCCPT